MGTKTVGGLVGFFTDENKLLAAAKKVKASGFDTFETISPFPVHGMDDAMGLKRSKIPIVSFFAGLVGTCTALGFESYVFVYDWPLNIGGKPHFALPSFVPIMFELTVLFSALTTVGTLIVWCGLPKLNPPIIDPSFTDNKFGLFIPENDKSFNQAKVDSLFRELGAEEVRNVKEY